MYKLIVNDIKWEKFDRESGKRIPHTPEECSLPRDFSVNIAGGKTEFVFSRIGGENSTTEYPWIRGSVEIEEILKVLFSHPAIREMAVNPLVFYVTEKLAAKMADSGDAVWRPTGLVAEMTSPDWEDEDDDWEEEDWDDDEEDWDDEEEEAEEDDEEPAALLKS